MWFNHVPQANADRYAKLVLPSHSQRGVVLSMLREYSSLQNFSNVLSTAAKPLSEYLRLVRCFASREAQRAAARPLARGLRKKHRLGADDRSPFLPH